MNLYLPHFLFFRYIYGFLQKNEVKRNCERIYWREVRSAKHFLKLEKIKRDEAALNLCALVVLAVLPVLLVFGGTLREF